MNEILLEGAGDRSPTEFILDFLKLAHPDLLS